MGNKDQYIPMMKPHDLHPPEEDLTDGLPLKSSEHSTTTLENVLTVSLPAPEIDIASYHNVPEIWY